MPSLYRSKIPIITRDLNEGFIRGDAPSDLSFGAVPRDYSVDPVEMRDSPSAMQLVPESEWDARFDEDDANETSLEHIYLRGGKPAFEFLDQNGFGDCWAHSTAHCIMLGAMLQGQPVVRLNGVAVATMLNRLNGGWFGLSMKFGRENGYPEIGTGPGQWPYQSRHGKDTPELRANMKRHVVLEDWYDLGKQVYDQELTKNQIATCSFNNHPQAHDYTKFGHSMACLRYVRYEKGAWGPLILNSWQGFGYYGLAVLAGMLPDNSGSLRSTTPSVS